MEIGTLFPRCIFHLIYSLHLKTCFDILFHHAIAFYKQGAILIIGNSYSSTLFGTFLTHFLDSNLSLIITAFKTHLLDFIQSTDLPVLNQVNHFNNVWTWVLGWSKCIWQSHFIQLLRDCQIGFIFFTKSSSHWSWDSQNFLLKFIRFFVTLGLKSWDYLGFKYFLKQISLNGINLKVPIVHE